MASTGATWLHNQRKTELVEIADKVGLKDYEDLKKSDLEDALDSYMRANSSRLSKDNSLVPYFKRVNSSAGKKDAPSSSKELVVSEAKTPKRRTTKAKEELEEAATSGAALVKSTAQRLSFASGVPLPPSPAQVANQIDRQTARMRSRLNKAYKDAGVLDFAEQVRDAVSTSYAIETLAILVELFGLQHEILPTKYLTMIPATAVTPDIPLKLPDLFALLRADFWATFSLWFATSILLPLTIAYFFNLTHKAKTNSRSTRANSAAAIQYDPLTFNIAKALLTYLVYTKEATIFGVPNEESRARIESNLPGGPTGVLIGAGIGILVSLYEAVLRS